MHSTIFVLANTKDYRINSDDLFSVADDHIIDYVGREFDRGDFEFTFNNCFGDYMTLREDGSVTPVADIEEKLQAFIKKCQEESMNVKSYFDIWRICDHWMTLGGKGPLFYFMGWTSRLMKPTEFIYDMKEYFKNPVYLVQAFDYHY